MKMLLKLVVSTVAILIAAYIVPGVEVASVTTALIVAVILGVLNTFAKPILLILTLPITILSLGLFTFIINAFLVYLAAMIIPGFGVASFWIALLFSLVVSLIGSFLSMFLD